MSEDTKVLIVDDSKAFRARLALMIRGFGIECIEATDGDDGLEMLEAHGSTLDAALIDWQMPKMDGLELVERIRSNADWDDISVAMVTAESDADRISEALDCGADEFLMKPFDEEMLAAKMSLLGLDVEHGGDASP